MSFRDEIVAKTALIAPRYLSAERQLVERVIEIFCTIKEPEIEFLYDFTLVKGPGSGGVNRKPGNILINWKRFFESVPNAVLAGAGAAAERWLLPFAALVIWNEIWKQSTIEISPRHAVALEAMWSNRDGKRRIEKQKALLCVNDLLSKYKLEAMTTGEFEETLNCLSDIDCIEIESEEVWLREWVRKEI